MEGNIEKFNYLVGVIFATLYRSFPCRKNIDFLAIIDCEECDETINESGMFTYLYKKDGEVKNLSDDFDFLYETLNWLYETGYLIGSVGSSPHGRHAIVTLSPKGLEILKGLPNSIGEAPERRSIGEELNEALNSAAKNKVSELGGQALSYLFKIGWGAVGGIG